MNKTNSILFHSHQQKLLTQIRFTIDDIPTDKKTFLGIIVNQNLTWTDHLPLHKNKISKNIGVIRRLNKILPLYSLRMLYYTLINP